MSKIKKLFTGEHKGFVIFVTAVTLVALLYLTFDPSANLIHWVRAKIEISRQEKQMELYRQEILRMDERIKMLESDLDTLEQFAREKAHFAEPGDDVYILK